MELLALILAATVLSPLAIFGLCTLIAKIRRRSPRFIDTVPIAGVCPVCLTNAADRWSDGTHSCPCCLEGLGSEIVHGDA